MNDEYSYQNYDFQGASGFSFGGVKADNLDGNYYIEFKDKTEHRHKARIRILKNHNDLKMTV